MFWHYNDKHVFSCHALLLCKFRRPWLLKTVKLRSPIFLWYKYHITSLTIYYPIMTTLIRDHFLLSWSNIEKLKTTTTTADTQPATTTLTHAATASSWKLFSKFNLQMKMHPRQLRPRWSRPAATSNNGDPFRGPLPKAALVRRPRRPPPGRRQLLKTTSTTSANL